VNHRYIEELGTDAAQVCGRTDAELTATGSIEGLRLEASDTAGMEPLELEYQIGAFEGRPAFAALRFALRDGDGQPTAVCGVAAPVAEARLARSECDRLMRIDRWRRLDAFAIRGELLEEWEFTLTEESPRSPLDVRAELEEQRLGDERAAAVLAERDEALAAAARLEEELSREREQGGSLRAESEDAVRRVAELDGAVAAERARSQELEQSRVAAEERVGELQAELSDVRAELEEQRLGDERAAAVLAERDEALAAAANQLSAEAPDAASSAAASNGLKWSTDSHSALSAALAGVTDWRAVLMKTVGVLGSEGGWDATVALSPDGPRGSIRCCGIWTHDPARLATFETRSWHHQAEASTGEFGRARNRMATTCLLDLQSAEDPLIRAAAAEGMGSALLMPITDGSETIAMLALFSRASTTPDGELMASMEAIAQQLSELAKVVRPPSARWRMARV
jgi:hypothetical protein